MTDRRDDTNEILRVMYKRRRVEISVTLAADTFRQHAERVMRESKARDRAAFDARWGEFLKCVGCGRSAAMPTDESRMTWCNRCALPLSLAGYSRGA